MKSLNNKKIYLINHQEIADKYGEINISYDKIMAIPIYGTITYSTLNILQEQQGIIESSIVNIYCKNISNNIIFQENDGIFLDLTDEEPYYIVKYAEKYNNITQIVGVKNVKH